MQKRLGVGGDYHRCVDHLPDGAPYGFVEIDMSHLVNPSIYDKFDKQISYRERQRKRKTEREESYAGKVESIQNEKFEKIKQEAIHAVNTESVLLKPQAIRHLFPSAADSTTDANEESKTEESKEEGGLTNTTGIPPRKESEEQQLWGGLLSGEAKIPFRIEQIEAQQKKALDEMKKKNKGDDDDGSFNLLSSISVIEVKQKKKKRR